MKHRGKRVDKSLWFGKYLISCKTLLLSQTEFLIPKKGTRRYLTSAIDHETRHVWVKTLLHCNSETSTLTAWSSYCWEISANHQPTWKILYQETLDLTEHWHCMAHVHFGSQTNLDSAEIDILIYNLNKSQSNIPTVLCNEMLQTRDICAQV